MVPLLSSWFVALDLGSIGSSPLFGYSPVLATWEASEKSLRPAIFSKQVVSLTEKLQAQEVMDQQTHLGLAHIDGGVHTSMKAKDGLSSGSGGSVVVDEDSPQLIDSGGSVVVL